MSINAKFARNRSWRGERLDMIQPSSSSMSSNTNLLLKTAVGPAAIWKIARLRPPATGSQTPARRGSWANCTRARRHALEALS